MQGLFIYVLTYFGKYSTNAVNADAQCRYGMINKTIPCLMYGCMSVFAYLNLIYFITYIRGFMFISVSIVTLCSSFYNERGGGLRIQTFEC